ncbi:MAG: acyl-[acyl-carrier-protein]--UDP-N-acetylglucosamine O-acyltransferase, partial [Candidatus Eremiobacteraeota bacterium]|nr:acyl-[acyl-carrier-protein]--UDP-N-acetylglucosamine O-acyltransferase [Candidatus Eremiobacteraeota bacterium]
MIHPTAIVHTNAQIDKLAEVGPYCIVGENASIGPRAVLQAHVVVNGWTEIGAECQIYPFATIGAASQDRKYTGERAFTRIGSRTILREYVSIQRATGHDEVTAVGDDCLLLAYVHIAHNCVLRNGVTMSNLA